MRRIIALAVLLSSVASVVFAQTMPAPFQTIAQCGQRDAVVKLLKSKHYEARVMIGTAQHMRTGKTEMIETWANKVKGTWTIVTTTEKQLSCMVMAGQNWHQIKPKVVGLEF